MSNPLIRKLYSFSDLAPEARDRIEALSTNHRTIAAGEDLIREGDRPEKVFLLLDGWACRYKILPDGKRQNLAYLIPGDLCDIHIFILKEMDHAIGLLTNATVAAIPKADMQSLLAERPDVAQALFWSTLVDEAVLREWLVNIAQRDAFARLAHLFCEMWLRMCVIGLTDGNGYAMPLTQEQLGDTVGLTPVHVNRVLQRMRGEGLITLSRRTLVIHDIDRLREVAGFNANYLHLDRRREPAKNIVNSKT